MIISASPLADLPPTRHKSPHAPRAKKRSSGSANNKGMLANSGKLHVSHSFFTGPSNGRRTILIEITGTFELDDGNEVCLC